MDLPPYYINDCPDRGRGVYANRRIKPREYIMTFTGEIIPADIISDFTHYLQIAPGMFLSPSGGADDYVNHSCNPNCSLFFENDELVLRAIRGIDSDQELMIDYGTIQFTEPTNFKCTCGYKACRGAVGSFFSLPEDIKKYYVEHNMVPLLSKFTLQDIKATMELT